MGRTEKGINVEDKMPPALPTVKYEHEHKHEYDVSSDVI
jgi:hypothetical protein